ncbi:MAG TPA: adenylate/guanylate cyclase domain-containing protein [Pyrinomonadaceae bacterium]|nr:adenylate/guanylate cyclase domain-containing protein [Pyrinomonadaceae bacterium]
MSETTIQALASETLEAEKQRVMVLLIIAAALAMFALVPPGYLGTYFERVFHGQTDVFMLWRFSVLGGLVCCLLAERLLLTYLIEKVPTAYRYITAFVETSSPTAGMLVAASFTDAASPISEVPVFIYPLFIVLSAMRLSFALSVFTGAVACVQYLCVQIFYLQSDPVYRPAHVSKGMFLLLLGVVTGVVAVQIRKRLVEACKATDERNLIARMFGEHLSAAVAAQLLAQGTDLRSEKKTVCVMFLDIRNFTTFSESRNPEEVVSYLENLFSFMIEIVNRHDGIINKFLGDGFMAVFGAPVSNGNDSVNAVNASREILSRLNVEIEQGNLPPTRIGIGLHSGDAVTATIGSNLRKEYTVIGDVVNLAARLEKLNKEFGSQLLISDEVRTHLLGNAGDAVPMGQVDIRGRANPIAVYQLA